MPSISGGNWKMNGTLESGKKLAETLKAAKLDSNVGAFRAVEGPCCERRFPSA